MGCRADAFVKMLVMMLLRSFSYLSLWSYSMREEQLYIDDGL